MIALRGVSAWVWVAIWALCAAGTLALGDDLAAPAMVRRAVQKQIQAEAQSRRQTLVSRAEDPDNFRSILAYLDLRRSVENANKLRWAGRDGALSVAAIGKLEEGMEAAKKRIQWPTLESHDGALLMEHLYIDEAIPAALESRLKDLGERESTASRARSEVDLEGRARSLRALAQELRGYQVQSERGASKLFDDPRAAELSVRIAQQYEGFLLDITRLDPTAMEKGMVLLGSAFTEVTIAAGGILIAGEDPKNVAAWLGLSATGVAMKGVEALVARDARQMVPLWGTAARADGWARSLQDSGVFPSQLFARQSAEIRSGMAARDWETVLGAFRHECSLTLAKLLGEGGSF